MFLILTGKSFKKLACGITETVHVFRLDGDTRTLSKPLVPFWNEKIVRLEVQLLKDRPPRGTSEHLGEKLSSGWSSVSCMLLPVLITTTSTLVQLSYCFRNKTHYGRFITDSNSGRECWWAGDKGFQWHGSVYSRHSGGCECVLRGCPELHGAPVKRPCRRALRTRLFCDTVCFTEGRNLMLNTIAQFSVPTQVCKEYTHQTVFPSNCSYMFSRGPPSLAPACLCACLFSR